MAHPGLLPGSLRYMIYVPASVEKQHLKKSFPFKDKGSPVLELFGSQVLEGSLVLAEAGGIKESHGLGDANLCVGAELAGHGLADGRLLRAHKAHHRRARGGRDGQRRVGAEARLSLHSC